MIFSMTGFGKSKASMGNAHYQIEVKSLNSKQLDIHVRIPIHFKEKEIAFRKLINTKLSRGKVELIISVEKGEESSSHIINPSILQGYIAQLKEMGLSADSSVVSALLKMPNVLKVEENAIEEKDWQALLGGIEEALEKLTDFRLQEGKAMQEDFEMRIGKIANFNKVVEENAPSRIEKIKARIKENLTKIEDIEVNESRLEQELIYYLEKLDVTEETVRLANHCTYFLETMNDDTVTKGKKLNFIAQELGREINTIGSKSNDTVLQKTVVDMKDELEKIKEQLNNVL
ncbi:MAG: YicC/YloC family endoribonuclease [Chitinophagales bacterium]